MVFQRKAVSEPFKPEPTLDEGDYRSPRRRSIQAPDFSFIPLTCRALQFSYLQ
jgi:hypothetical protein